MAFSTHEPATPQASQHGEGSRTRSESAQYDFVVIGAGPAGLAAALEARRLTDRVLLVDRGTTSVRSGVPARRALFEAAQLAHATRMARRAGFYGQELHELNLLGVLRRVRELQGEALRSALSRAAADGIRCVTADARFIDAQTLDAAGQRVHFERALIATGTHPVLPAVDGLDDAAFVDSDSVYGLDKLPRRLLVVGGTSEGCEFAQAFARLGSRVTLLEGGPMLLPGLDPELLAPAREAYESDGIRVLTNTELVRVELTPDGSRIAHCEHGLSRSEEVYDEILLATGKVPYIVGLGLEHTGVEFDRYGVRVDAYLRTTNPRIFAAGAVCTIPAAAEAAAPHGRIAARNALTSSRERARSAALVSATYTDPQILDVREGTPASREHGLHAISLDLPPESGLLAARAGGLARFHVHGRDGRLVRATLIAPNAHELRAELSLAIGAGLSLRATAGRLAARSPEPQLLKRVADEFVRQRPTLLDRLRAWLRSRRL